MFAAFSGFVQQWCQMQNWRKTVRKLVSSLLKEWQKLLVLFGVTGFIFLFFRNEM
jgi:hypothetical protein